MSRQTLSRESVFNAMLALHHKAIAVTRKSFQQVTGESLARIRERIDSLRKLGTSGQMSRKTKKPAVL